MLVSSINEHSWSLIRDLLRLSHLPGQGPLPRPLHGEAEGSGVPPPGRVLLSQMPGHGVDLHISPDLFLVSVKSRVGIEPSLSSVPFVTECAGPCVVCSRPCV